MLKLDCEINQEEVNSSIDSMRSIVDYVSYLLTTFYRVVSGKLLAEILREKLGK